MMLGIRLQILYLLFIGTLLSCPLIAAPTSELWVFEKEDKECNENNAIKDLGKRKIWIESNTGKIELIEFDFTGLSGKGLKSSIYPIEDTRVGYHHVFKSLCEPNIDEDCSGPIYHFTENEGDRLYFCRNSNDTPYNRQSLENVALATAAGIIMTIQATSKSLNPPHLKKLTLLIHPLLEDRQKSFDTYKNIWSERGSFRYGNIYWIHSTDLNPTYNEQETKKSSFFIAIAPDDRLPFLISHDESKKDSECREPRVWENLFLVSHEYGHHIFYHEVPSLVEATDLDLACENKHHKYIAEGNDNHQIISRIINEAFADLIAFNTYKEKNLINRTLDWFSHKGNMLDRFVGSKYWNSQSNKTKLLEEEYLDFFLRNYRSPQSENSDKFCETINLINYSDVHTFGAILAYGVNRFIESLLETNTSKKRIDFILEWGKFLEEEFKNKHCHLSKENFYKVLNFFAHRLSNDKFKTILEEVFPMFNIEKYNIMVLKEPDC